MNQLVQILICNKEAVGDMDRFILSDERNDGLNNNILILGSHNHQLAAFDGLVNDLLVILVQRLV